MTNNRRPPPPPPASSDPFAVFGGETPAVVESNRIPLEREVETRFINRLKSIGGFSWKFKSQTQRSVTDRIVVYKGRTIFVEMKRAGKDLTEKQEIFRTKVLHYGCEHATVSGDDGTFAFIKKLTTTATPMNGDKFK